MMLRALANGLYAHAFLLTVHEKPCVGEADADDLLENYISAFKITDGADSYQE